MLGKSLGFANPLLEFRLWSYARKGRWSREFFFLSKKDGLMRILVHRGLSLKLTLMTVRILWEKEIPSSINLIRRSGGKDVLGRVKWNLLRWKLGSNDAQMCSLQSWFHNSSNSTKEHFFCLNFSLRWIYYDQWSMKSDQFMIKSNT